jgi:hypothetical protein
VRAPRPDRAAVVAALALAPLVVVAVLRLPLLNQLDWADAWFYSAYAWVPKHHFAVYGWTYFSVRFPAILSIGVFERVFGTDAGYVVLRYVLAVVTAGALYLCVRLFASVWIALATALLLYLDPFFSRMLLWDYAGFAAISAGVAGFALWWWADGRRLGWTLLPGVALALALFANALIATALVVLFLVELAAALRGGRETALRAAARFGVAVGAGLLVFALGYLGYVAVIGSFGPGDLIRPTIDFLRSNSENSAPYQRPVSDWLLHELRIWSPVVLSVAVAAALGRRLLGTDLPARIGQFCIGYTALLWVYRFTVTSSVIETWWAYAFVVVAMAPALGVLLWAIAERARVGWLDACVPLVFAALAAVLIRNLPGPAVRAYHDVAAHPAAIFALLAVGLVGALALALRGRLASVVGLSVVLVVVTVMTWAPSVLDGRGTTGVFVTDGGTEWKAYDGARSFIRLVRDYDSPNSRVYTWYPGTSGLTSIGWTTLPQDGTTVQNLALNEPLDHLTPLGRARLLQPNAGFVLVMSPHAEDVRAARAAIVGNGFGLRLVRRGAWADGRLRYALFSLRR